MVVRSYLHGGRISTRELELSIAIAPGGVELALLIWHIRLKALHYLVPVEYEQTDWIQRWVNLVL